MNSSFDHLTEPELRQIVEVLLAQPPNGELESVMTHTHSEPVEIARRGDCLCVSGGWRKEGPRTVARLAKMLEQYKSEQVNRILLIDPRTSASESRSIKKEWSNRIRQFQHKTGRKTGFEIQVWDAEVVREHLRRIPALELRYFPDDVPDGRARLERIEAARRSFLERSRSVHGRIQFVGMSVYKEEATAAVDLESLYIPLRLVGEAANESDPSTRASRPSDKKNTHDGPP